MDTTLRRLERRAATGDREADIRLYLERYKLGMIPPRLTSDDMFLIALPLIENICEGFGNYPVCQCELEECYECAHYTTIDCDGCLACLAPSIYYSYSVRTIEWIGNCIHGYSRADEYDYPFCDCTYCIRLTKFQRALGTLKVLRMIERSVSK